MRKSPGARIASKVVALALAGAAASLIGVESVSAAKPLTVCASGCQFTTIADALTSANDGDMISIGPGSYSGGIFISKSVSLRGAGAAQTTSTGSAPSFHGNNVIIASGVSVTIGGVTIGPITDISGSEISNSGRLAVRDSIVRGANDVFGGGIVNAGTMTLERSLVTNNFADVGGGIDNGAGGTMMVKNSTVTQNGAGLVGGGIYNQGTMMVKNSTITDNHSRADSGSPLNGGLVNTGTLTLKNDTITGNTPYDCVGC